MSLILKTDVKYTGVIAARHILELLQVTSEKTSYIKSMLADVGADSSYVTDTTSPTITTKLLDHVKLVQKAGATVLSMQYTVKAIVFVLKNNLADNSYACFSPDFGISYFPNGNIDRVYGLSGNMGSEKAGYPFKLGNDSNNNTLMSSSTTASGVVISQKPVDVNEGIIIASCGKLNTNRPLGAVIGLVDGNDSRITLTPKLNLARGGTSSNVSFNLATTAATGTGQVYSGTGYTADFFHMAGVVAKFEYGTTANKIYVNGEELVSNSGDTTMFDLSTYTVRAEADIKPITDGVVEQWVVNSKSDVLAQALSNHLNRQ